jgi:hypothetical protein
MQNIKIQSNGSKTKLAKINPDVHEALRVIAFTERTSITKLINDACAEQYHINLNENYSSKSTADESKNLG